jgi:hypothetical protein
MHKSMFGTDIITYCSRRPGVRRDPEEEAATSFKPINVF